MVVSKISTSTMPDSPGPSSPVKAHTEMGPAKQAKKTKDDNRDDILQRSSIIKDDQVLVNLAMADLMAYLQVVANNSNNLPLTRRDDPELTRMVTNLSSEEYARKSAAFIPADVRVIAGSFLKYGNVWDLPTSEEYVASDGAQEPGRSYGGACSNSMLKVLYDAASEAVGVPQDDEIACDALFDDDDDESLATLPFTRNNTFASLDMNGQSNPSTITWAELLRKMKTEINDIEYVQAPTIGATRKFDLNQPFSLVPESFDKATGKKRSLLIGCNYHGTEGAELKASHDDICSMKDYIINVHGFAESDDMMTVLLDDGLYKPPTFLNIVEAFKSLSEQSQPGDAVFIQFSGHGGRILDSPINNNVESYDEILVPSDYTASGIIRDTLIFKTLLAPMRYGVNVTIVIDSCDTGMVLDLPYSWSTRSDKPGAVAKMKQSENFSFVRFLKVVKTLYESSTFTQLGRTVGTALGEQPTLDESSDEEEEEEEVEKIVPTIERTETEDMQTGSVLGLCTPRSKPANPKPVPENNERDPFSLIEKMLGCNFLVHDLDDDYSDGETFANNTYNTFDDTLTMGNESTFDSLSDGEYKRAIRRKRRSRRK
mmetsp:Transcript_13004/g.36619  ORF Transcript_13004/g.36619 Transcript_13004/m.36619 type:complete len:599 (+) Transcript_13004:305-2101(+)